jgi:hypothetical protein
MFFIMFTLFVVNFLWILLHALHISLQIILESFHSENKVTNMSLIYLSPFVKNQNDMGSNRERSPLIKSFVLLARIKNWTTKSGSVLLKATK